MLTSLGHRAVGSRNDENATVHLRGTGDHVLHIVSVARAIDVCIVTCVGFIFDVCRRNRDAALALFRSLIDVGKVNGDTAIGFSQNLRDRCGQRGLTMVNVTDGADVAVRLVPLKFSLRHFSNPRSSIGSMFRIAGARLLIQARALIRLSLLGKLCLDLFRHICRNFVIMRELH